MREDEMSRALQRERLVYEYLRDVAANNEASPSIREIGRACGVSSTSMVGKTLDALEEKGLIQRTVRNNRTAARTIRLTDGVAPAERLQTVRIPLLGTVAAGQPLFAQEHFEGFVPVQLHARYRPQELFALTIRGESMRDAGIMNGDTVVVQRTPTADDGEIIVALLGDEATCKTLYREKGRVRLQPQNHEMAPIYAEEVTVLGRVIACIRTY